MVLRSAPVIMVFVDGLGVGGNDPAVNPLCAGGCPHLQGILHDAKPIDACLGVAGLPQSATGQAALLTGVNAAVLMGRHIEGFPGPRLRELIRQGNLFSKVTDCGLRSTFANAYYMNDVHEVAAARIQSVTTVAALSAHGTVRCKAELLADEAVYQDLTRAHLRKRGYAGKLITPREAAGHLVALGRQHDLTLFEYFQTDRAGHSRSAEHARAVLRDLDAFMGALREQCEAQEMRLILTSDHGNIEDITVGTHTLNPVPFFAAGPGTEALFEEVHALTDVTPAIVGFLSR